MGYEQLIGSIIAGIGAAVWGNEAKKAGGGYAAQIGKYKTVEPIEPDAPKTVEWQSILNEVLGTNMNNAAQREQLAARTNRFNVNQARNMYSQMQPYFDSLNRQVGQNVDSYSKGELPADVVANVSRAAASRGLQSGFGQGARAGGAGGSMGSLNLRNLGLTSLQLSQYGTQQAMEANKLAKYLSPELADSLAWSVSPQMGIGYEAANVGIENEAARYWNELQNKAIWDNTAIRNQANQMAAEGKLAGRMANAQMNQQAAMSAAGAASGSGGGGGGGGFMSMFGGG